MDQLDNSDVELVVPVGSQDVLVDFENLPAQLL